MQYGVGAQKYSQVPAYRIGPGRRSILYSLRRTRSRFLLVVVGGVLSFFFILRLLFGSSGDIGSAGIEPVVTKSPAGVPNVVIVTVLEEGEGVDKTWIENVKGNRVAYAELHGYATFFPSPKTYELDSSTPGSWAKVPALRHAMTEFPRSTFFFYLDSHVLIMNPSLTVEQHITKKERLENLMRPDIPVVTDSVIKTFGNLKGDAVDLILTQDKDGLSVRSLIMRRGEWAKFCLDVWFDPLYRSYNFQKAERHALEHTIQWHGTILAKIGVVHQKIMSSYHEKEASLADEDGVYKDGDFILDFGDCQTDDRNCVNEMGPYISRFKQQLELR